MTEEPGTASVPPSERRSVNVWMIVGIVALVLAAIAAYFAFSYRQEVQDWEAAADETLVKLQAAGVQVQQTVVSGVNDYEEQIADLATQLDQAITQAGVAESGQAATQQELDDTKAELATTQEELETAQQDLAATQSGLDAANATLAQLGEVVLADGTYIGVVLDARTEPVPAIVFQDGDAWRVSEVSPEVLITSGGQELTLEEFSTLLRSTDVTDVELVNGNYQVKVKDGLVTSIRKSQT